MADQASTAATSESEILNIVILGASFAGCALAHHFLERVMPMLGTTAKAPRYRVVLISPSTHLYWNIAAPRILVSSKLIPYSDAFVPIEPGFKRYGDRYFTFIQALAVDMDPTAHTITVQFTGKEGRETTTASRRATMISKKHQSLRSITHQKTASAESNGTSATGLFQTIPYHALILATGSRTATPLLTLHGPHLHTVAALDLMHRRLPTARNIIISGGGPSGVETAGQIATYLSSNLAFQTSGLSKRDWRRLNSSRSITLVSGTKGLLPNIDASVGSKAERQLKGLGVKVLKGLRVVEAVSSEGRDPSLPPRSPAARTRLVLSDGRVVEDVEVYIPCTGVRPNTGYIPERFLDADGYANTDQGSDTPLSLRLLPRVPEGTVGEEVETETLPTAARVYAIGDCASYSANYVLDVYDAVPVLMHNLTNDLLIWELKDAQPYGGNEDEIEALEGNDAVFVGRRAKPKKEKLKKEVEQKVDEARGNVGRKKLIKGVRAWGSAKKDAIAGKRGRKGKIAVQEENGIQKAIEAADGGADIETAAVGMGVLPEPTVDKSRWSGLSIDAKEGSKAFETAPNSPTKATPVGDLKSPAKSVKMELPPNEAKTEVGEEVGKKSEKTEHTKVMLDTQLCPITRFGGAGIIFGLKLPSLMVYIGKGRDYRVAKAKKVVFNGNNPY
ncbi:MAG: hypothetical protein M1820_010601 [Bogoriella megaspora]|nr:MAG: hypothetical protein M1820_010601 [Bogoriella megaspora]